MDDKDPKQDSEEGGIKAPLPQHDLHSIFDAACLITAPFFDAKQSWGGASLTMYARQALREAYPALTQQEIAILLSKVVHYHGDTHKE